MKIVICDDCMEDLVQVERLLQKYEKNANSKFEVETFSDASKVYHKVLQHELADIYILDMIMPQKSGIDIGSLLEKMGRVSSSILRLPMSLLWKRMAYMRRGIC